MSTRPNVALKVVHMSLVQKNRPIVALLNVVVRNVLIPMLSVAMIN